MANVRYVQFLKSANFNFPHGFIQSPSTLSYVNLISLALGVAKIISGIVGTQPFGEYYPSNKLITHKVEHKHRVTVLRIKLCTTFTW